MRLDTLSARILGALAAILVLLLLAAAIFGEIKIRAFHKAEIETQLRNATEMLAGQGTDLLAGRTDAKSVGAHLADLGKATNLRLTVIRADGTVLADSEASLPLANHADRPEVQMASREGVGVSNRHSATTDKDTYYLARRLDEGANSLGYVRAAAELDVMERAITALRASLVFGGLVTLLFGLLLSYGLARWISKPLEEMGEGALTVTSGNLDARIPSRGPHEVRLLAGALNSMADKLRQRIRSEQRARGEIETILASMAEGVIALDGRERVLLMNDAAARMLDLDAALDTGETLWQRLRFADLERGLRASLESGEPWHADAVSPREDGRTLSISVAPVRGESSGAVALLSDVTEIRRLEQVRRDFVANVSHEMRTPLSAVLGALETLADEAQDETVRHRFLDIAQRNAVRLQAIVADLLDLSTIEARGESMSLEPVRIDEPLRSAAAALSGAAQKKGVELAYPAPSPSFPVVQGNRQRLEQAFTNLIANAIHYTPGGGQVRARVRSSPKEVAVEVEDNGIGIPAASLPRVFERFFRVDRGRSRDTGGTGLGLAIVKHIALAHGGRVEVRSEEGRGSTFSILFPGAGTRS